MKIHGKHYRTIWCEENQGDVHIIDQTRLPFTFKIATLTDLTEARDAIKEMWVRGAPLVGATAAYGVALAMRTDPSDKNLQFASDLLFKARPTAVNLAWALQQQNTALNQVPLAKRATTAYQIAAQICDQDVALCDRIGEHGLTLIQAAAAKKPGKTLHVLTHCNAGWLATVDWGTALSPIYKAHNAGIPIHVWVDETRPRNQGAALTAYELGQQGVPHTVIVDNAGGHLMQHGLVDLCFVGTDRTTRTGDVCNKIGTYLKALAAHDNQIPFYVCAPSPSIDFNLTDGLTEIPIEQRSPQEVSQIQGVDLHGNTMQVNILPTGSEARNDAFDVTPSRYISALITEKGIIQANEKAIKDAFMR